MGGFGVQKYLPSRNVAESGNSLLYGGVGHLIQLSLVLGYLIVLLITSINNIFSMTVAYIRYWMNAVAYCFNS